jgi:ribosomal protein L11 methylase PrmA
MPAATPESGSYRDRRGRIFYVDDRVLRTVMPLALEDFEFVRASGLIDALIDRGRLTAETIVDKDILGPEGDAASLVLEHPKLPFISYPYEWCFSALKDAALLQLDIQLEALERDIAMTDASAYNVQFLGSKPIFIDNLSFRRYCEGEFWDGHRQFCEQFANPLVLRAVLGVPHNAWFRGALEGITAEDLSRMLPWRSRLSWNILTNVFMQARLQRSASSGDGLAKAQARRLPKIGFEQMLRSLRNWLAKLEPSADSKTVWQDYADDNSYAADEARQKRNFIAEFTAATQPSTVIDIGCNTGDFSIVALESGAERCIGFDFDQGALEYAYRRARDNALNFTPLLLDAANPSPEQGWLQAERRGFSSRAKGDAVLALALVHHLAIAKNIPLQQVLDWLLDMAPRGVIEFVPKNDAMVQRLLQNREDLFDDYSPETFESLLRSRARMEKKATVSSSGRTLYWFERD